LINCFEKYATFTKRKVIFFLFEFSIIKYVSLSLDFLSLPSCSEMIRKKIEGEEGLDVVYTNYKH